MYGDSSISSSYVRREESPVYFQSAVLVTLVTVCLWSSLTKTLPWLQEEWRGFFRLFVLLFFTFTRQDSNWQLFSLFKWASVEKKLPKNSAIVRHKTW